MDRPRAADDFATIRARLKELRRERECAGGAEVGSGSDPLRVWGDRIGPVVIAIRRLRNSAG
jgi:hypothetical protein